MNKIWSCYHIMTYLKERIVLSIKSLHNSLSDYDQRLLIFRFVYHFILMSHMMKKNLLKDFFISGKCIIGASISISIFVSEYYCWDLSSDWTIIILWSKPTISKAPTSKWSTIFAANILIDMKLGSELLHAKRLTRVFTIFVVVDISAKKLLVLCCNNCMHQSQPFQSVTGRYRI